MTARPRLADAGRLLALAATAFALLATSGPDCYDGDRGVFDVDTTCGPPGAVTLSYEDPPAGCREDCWGLVEADGAAAVGLPSFGEIHPEWDPFDPDFPDSRVPPGTSFIVVSFALVGEAPISGATPPATVRRICRTSPSAAPGVVAIGCEGDAPQAACSGTLTLRGEAP